MLKCTRQNLYQPLPKGKGAKNITIPFSLCLHTVHAKKPSKKKQGTITNILFILKSIRTNCQCKIKYLFKCSLMKSCPWKPRPMKTCFAFQSFLVSRRGDWLQSLPSRSQHINQTLDNEGQTQNHVVFFFLGIMVKAGEENLKNVEKICK